MWGGDGESITANAMTSRPTNVTETDQCLALVTYRIAEVRPHRLELHLMHVTFAEAQWASRGASNANHERAGRRSWHCAMSHTRRSFATFFFLLPTLDKTRKTIVIQHLLGLGMSDNLNMAVNVYEYGRGGKCVYKLTMSREMRKMLRFTYAGIREMKTRMQMEKEDRHMSRVMRTSIGTVEKIVEKEKTKQKGGYDYTIEQNTKHAARATQVERQVEKKALHTHTTQTHRNRQIDKECA